MVEVDIVCNKNCFVKNFFQFISNLMKRRRALEHVVVNTCQSSYKRWNSDARIDEGRKLPNNLFTIMKTNTYFNDAIAGSMAAGSFYICDGVEQFE